MITKKSEQKLTGMEKQEATCWLLGMYNIVMHSDLDYNEQLRDYKRVTMNLWWFMVYERKCSLFLDLVV